jgi:hypothetical protein
LAEVAEVMKDASVLHEALATHRFLHPHHFLVAQAGYVRWEVHRGGGGGEERDRAMEAGLGSFTAALRSCLRAGSPPLPWPSSEPPARDGGGPSPAFAPCLRPDAPTTGSRPAASSRCPRTPHRHAGVPSLTDAFKAIELAQLLSTSTSAAPALAPATRFLHTADTAHAAIPPGINTLSAHGRAGEGGAFVSVPGRRHALLCVSLPAPDASSCDGASLGRRLAALSPQRAGGIASSRAALC